MESKLKQLFREKRFYIASFILVWAAGLQGHMMWLQRQDAFKQKFGTLEEGKDGNQQLADIQ